MTKELSFKENLLWNSIGNLVYLGCQWLLSYITTRALGYEPAGILSLAMSISGSISNIALYSMRNYQSSDVSSSFSDGTYIRSRFITSTVSFFACLLFVGMNGYAFDTASCIMAFMILKIIEAVSDVYQGIMQRHMRMDYIGKSFMVKGILGLIVFTSAIFATRNLLIALLALCLINAAIVCCYDRLRARELSSDTTPVKSDKVKKLLRTCFPLALFGLLFNTMGQAPRYFLELLLGTEMLGYYASVAMPVTIVQVSASFIFSPLTTPLAKQFDSRDRNGFKKTMLKVICAVAVLSICALGAAVLLGDWALLFLFGNSIASYTYLIVPLVLSGILLAFSWFLSTVVTIIRELKRLLAASIASFATVVIGSTPMINTFGMNGASYILIVAMLVFIVLNATIIVRYFSKMQL